MLSPATVDAITAVSFGNQLCLDLMSVGITWMVTASLATSQLASSLTGRMLFDDVALLTVACQWYRPAWFGVKLTGPYTLLPVVVSTFTDCGFVPVPVALLPQPEAAGPFNVNSIEPA